MLCLLGCREDMSSSGDSDSSDDNSEDEQPPDLPNGASVTRKRAILPAEANPYGTMGLEALLEAATKVSIKVVPTMLWFCARLGHAAAGCHNTWMILPFLE